jgi:hypothetical protein
VSRSDRFLPPGKDPVPFVQETGWVPGAVWTSPEISHPPEFDPRTVQPVASRYTDYATRPTSRSMDWYYPIDVSAQAIVTVVTGQVRAFDCFDLEYRTDTFRQTT